MKSLILAKVKESDANRPDWVAVGPLNKTITQSEAAELVRKSYSSMEKVFKIKIVTCEDNLDIDYKEELYIAEQEEHVGIAPVETLEEIKRLQDVIHETFENRSDAKPNVIIFFFSLIAIVSQTIALILLLLLK